MGICSSKKQNDKKKHEIKEVQSKLEQPQIIRQINKAKSMVPQMTKTNQSDNVNDSFISKVSSIRAQERMKKVTIIRQGLFKLYTIFVLTDGSLYILQHNVSGIKKRMEVVLKNNNTTVEYLNKIKRNNLTNPHISWITDIYQDNDFYYLLSDYCSGGSLKQYKGKFSEKQIIALLEQMFEVIQYLHNKKLVHPLLNINSFHLLNQQNSVFCKLIDATYIFKQQNKVRIEPTQFEQLNDIRILGQIIFELITGKQYNNQQYDLIELASVSSKDLYHLLKQMLDIKNIKTLSIENLMSTLKTIKQDEIVCERLVQPLLRLSKTKQINYFNICILNFIGEKFKQEELEILKKIFQEADQNQDGLLDKDNIIHLFKIIPNEQTILYDIDSIFSQIEQEHIGYINEKEFISSTLNLEEVLTDDILQASFKYLSNQNTYISITSLKKHFEFDENHMKLIMNEQYGQCRLNYSNFQQIMKQLLQ